MNHLQIKMGHRVGRKSGLIAPSAEWLALRRITPANDRRLIRPTLLEAILAELGGGGMNLVQIKMGHRVGRKSGFIAPSAECSKLRHATLHVQTTKAHRVGTGLPVITVANRGQARSYGRHAGNFWGKGWGDE